MRACVRACVCLCECARVHECMCVCECVSVCEHTMRCAGSLSSNPHAARSFSAQQEKPRAKRTVERRGLSLPHAGGDSIVNTMSPDANPVKFQAAGDTW